MRVLFTTKLKLRILQSAIPTSTLLDYEQAWPQHDLVPKVLFEFYLFHMIEIQGIHKRGITLVQKVQKK